MSTIADFSKIKALALDLDGTTLMPDASLGERTAQNLRRLITGGRQVIFCTGRAIEASSRYYSAIGANGPMVFFNGAEVANITSDKSADKFEVRLITSNLMSLEVIDFGADLARRMGLHFQVFFPPQGGLWEKLIIEKTSPESEMYCKHTGITPVVADLKTIINNPENKGCVKAMFIADPSLLEEIRQKMISRFGDTIYTARSYPTFLEIMNAGVSKGEGLKTVMSCRGLKPEEIMAFGDEENDLPMFAVAGFSAAPSSAKEKIRNVADYIFGPNAEEGLADFLEKMFV